MTPESARRLLDLTVEYTAAVAVHDSRWDHLPGKPTGRSPEEIAEEYAKLASD